MTADNPFGPEHFRREDEADDALFYTMPRQVAHIDDAARAALAAFFASRIPQGARVLDLMSSRYSHLPEGARYEAVVGLGMNAAELAANPALTGRLVQNLNRAPWLPFTDAAFGACLLTVSAQYLIKPAQVFAEAARVLAPGAPMIVSYSNRCFPTKATAVWRALDARGHARLISSYFALAAGFKPATLEDLSPAGGVGDPLYIVCADRSRGRDQNRI